MPPASSRVSHTPIPRYRRFAGPVLFREGFRPFFLLAGTWALAAIALWLAMLAGRLPLPGEFDLLAWHMHEMVFGYATATVAGFLLTAIPNWTGRLPLQGPSLIGLVALWLAGRLAMAGTVWLGPWATAALDLAFLLVLLAAVAREIVAGRNWRNLPVSAVLGLLATANLLFHAGVLELANTLSLSIRLGIGLLVLLIALIGGRVTPSFTRNWLVKRGVERLPASFGHVDRAAMVLAGLGVAGWVAAPESRVTAVLLLAASLALALRLARWQGHRTLAEPLLLALHLGYAWVPVGFAVLAVSILHPAFPPSSALHALTVGAIGTMTLAVMTRAIRGHTGRPLSADGVTTALFAAITLAVLLRLAAALVPDWYFVVVDGAGLAWIAAYVLFLVRYGPMLLRPRPGKA
ncbi:MAG TPA: NnrS family protein [Alphaproteobacteria bacterium]|nr:NnrS family protein [Alphaproteobacteria bacterium]